MWYNLRYACFEAVWVRLLISLVGPAVVGLFDWLDSSSDGRDHFVPAHVVHPTPVQGLGGGACKKTKTRLYHFKLQRRTLKKVERFLISCMFKMSPAIRREESKASRSYHFSSFIHSLNLLILLPTSNGRLAKNGKKNQVNFLKRLNQNHSKRLIDCQCFFRDFFGNSGDWLAEIFS